MNMALAMGIFYDMRNHARACVVWLLVLFPFRAIVCFRPQFLQKQFVQRTVCRQFRMKCRNKVPALFHQDGVALEAGQHFHAFTNSPDDRSANEDGFEVLRCCVASRKARSGIDVGNTTVELPPVRVPFDVDVHHVQRFLYRVGYLGGQKNRPRARAEHRLHFRKALQRFQHIFHAKQFQHGCAFTARYNQPFHLFQLFRRTHRYRFGTGLLKRFLMSLEIALQREDSDPSHAFIVRVQKAEFQS